MGPASDNAGYACIIPFADPQFKRLQWVRRRITPVMLLPATMRTAPVALQWVRRRITPVMRAAAPRSLTRHSRLQWVRRRITPVMAGVDRQRRREQQASMGPASDNAGYV